MHEPVPLGVGLRHGVRNQVAPSKSSARACSGPRASDPQTGWPPMKRPSRAPRDMLRPSSTRRRSPSSGRRWPRARAAICAPSCATGAATTARSASASASASDPAGLVDRASLDGGLERPLVRVAAGDPLRRPARLAASPTEAPIRPVPTIAMRIPGRMPELGSRPFASRARAHPYPPPAQGERTRVRRRRSAAQGVLCAESVAEV